MNRAGDICLRSWSDRPCGVAYNFDKKLGGRISGLPWGSLMARRADSDQILGGVTAQSAAGPNVMDLKILHPPARLTPPRISFQDFPAELAISFNVKLQAWRLCAILVKVLPALVQGVASAAASADH
jgi:hypothetical protein